MNDLRNAPEAPASAPRSVLAPERRYWTALTVTLAGAIVFALVLQTPPALSPNDTSRWNAIWAMVHTGRCSWVGDKPFWTIDRCTYDPIPTTQHAQSARWYSSKPYFMQVLAAGVAWPFCRLLGLNVADDLAVVGRLIIIAFNVVPFLLLVTFYGRLLGKMGVESFTFAFCLLTAAAGTYLSGWCITLNNHIPAAVCVFFAMYALHEIAANPRAGLGWHLAAGLFAGMATAFEVQAAAVAGLGGALVWWLRRRNAAGVVAFAAAAGLPVAAYFVCNRVCTGRWTSFQWTFPRHYDPYWARPTGIDALDEPKGWYLFNLLLGHHGFFSLTPVFLVAAVGLVRNLRAPGPLRPLALLTGLASVVLIGFETAVTSNYGGTSQGARWLFWLIPIWLVMLPAGVEGARGRSGGRWLLLASLGVSTFSVGYALKLPWSRSWLHDLFYLAGLTNY